MRTVEENDLPSCLKAKTISNDILITIYGDNKPMLSKKMRDGRVPSPHVSHTDHLQLLVDKNEAFAAWGEFYTFLLYALLHDLLNIPL